MASADASTGAGLPAPLELPEREFMYSAGSTDRPWFHFTGRWAAIKTPLAEMLAARAATGVRPRLLDVGSCTGFFALQAANQHADLDVVGVEGSVGIGNGTVGTAGNIRAILQTYAVKNHLKWIQQLDLQNCRLAPEVWDYAHLRDLHAQGRPICDVMLTLSVIHHIDNVSAEQYAALGLSRLDGTIDLIAKLLSLAPRHFVELPNRPWMTAAYDAHQTQRRILEAATKQSGIEWKFTGPIYSVDWFGNREVWILEAVSGMAEVTNEETGVFRSTQLFRGDEALPQAAMAPANASLGPDDYMDVGYDDPSTLRGLIGTEGGAYGGLGVYDSLGAYDTQAARSLHGGALSMDPALSAMVHDNQGPVEDQIGEALAAAPTALLVAHLSLREAVAEATDVLSELRSGAMGGVGVPRRQVTMA